MAGVEKIISQIEETAKKQSDEILAEAKAYADGILAEAKASGDKAAAEILEKAKADKEAIESRTISSIDLKKRQALLKAKQETISEVLNKAYNELATQPDGKYFDMIEKLVEGNAQKAAGVIKFSKADLNRMPAGFEDKIKAAAAKCGGSLELSKDAADIENGFVLIYGDIEENCSLKAIFDAKHDELTDLVNKTIF